VIHYHGTPFSGGDKNNIALAGHHAMVSYALPLCVNTIAEVCQSFCLDNGAFSAWKKGVEYNFDGYREWADKWLKHPGCDFAIIPDVIDGTEAQNDDFIRWLFGSFDDNALIKSQWVPVWHLHESIDRLAALANEWPRVALGSSGEYAEIGDRRWWNRMADAMDEITDTDGFPFTRLHGLRMLDPGIFSYVPFTSADSTNVARNIGIDVRWTGPYVPRTARTRALVIMDRIESHACASIWHKGFVIKQGNFDLIDGSVS
jgi:hypothetical protein